MTFLSFYANMTRHPFLCATFSRAANQSGQWHFALCVRNTGRFHARHGGVIWWQFCPCAGPTQKVEFDIHGSQYPQQCTSLECQHFPWNVPCWSAALYATKSIIIRPQRTPACASCAGESTRPLRLAVRLQYLERSKSCFTSCLHCSPEEHHPCARCASWNSCFSSGSPLSSFFVQVPENKGAPNGNNHSSANILAVSRELLAICLVDIICCWKCASTTVVAAENNWRQSSLLPVTQRRTDRNVRTTLCTVSCMDAIPCLARYSSIFFSSIPSTATLLHSFCMSETKTSFTCRQERRWRAVAKRLLGAANFSSYLRRQKTGSSCRCRIGLLSCHVVSCSTPPDPPIAVGRNRKIIPSAIVQQNDSFLWMSPGSTWKNTSQWPGAKTCKMPNLRWVPYYVWYPIYRHTNQHLPWELSWHWAEIPQHLRRRRHPGRVGRSCPTVEANPCGPWCCTLACIWTCFHRQLLFSGCSTRPEKIKSNTCNNHSFWSSKSVRCTDTSNCNIQPQSQANAWSSHWRPSVWFRPGCLPNSTETCLLVGDAPA